jgi:hypothetical protein
MGTCQAPWNNRKQEGAKRKNTGKNCQKVMYKVGTDYLEQQQRHWLIL